MARSKFEYISRNLHFLENIRYDKSDKGCKIRSLINRFKESFGNSVSNDNYQGTDNHMVKFKGWSSTKQYVKNKPIKWDLKFSYHYSSERIPLSIGLHSDKKESREENLGPGVVLLSPFKIVTLQFFW